MLAVSDRNWWCGWVWLKWRSPQAQLEELHRRAVELERQRRFPSVGPSASARLQELSGTIETWAERHPGRAAPRRIEKSVMDRGGRINLPGLENPNADSWVEVPRGGGCPWLLEGPEMQCVIVHEPKQPANTSAHRFMAGHPIQTK